MKFPTKLIQHYPPHLRHVATLPWEIENTNFLQIFDQQTARKCKRVAFLSPGFVIDPQISIFSVFNKGNFSPYWLQIKFFMPLFFYLFTLAINLWHTKFVTADVTAVFVNSEHGIEQREQDFDKKIICNQYGENLLF